MIVSHHLNGCDGRLIRQIVVHIAKMNAQRRRLQLVVEFVVGIPFLTYTIHCLTESEKTLVLSTSADFVTEIEREPDFLDRPSILLQISLPSRRGKNS